MGDDSVDDDPGWPSIGPLLLGLIPGYLRITRLARSRHGDSLVLLRTVFLNFSSSLVLFAIVLQVIGNPGPNHVLPFLWLAVIAGALSVVFVAVTVKPLDCSSVSQLAMSYRGRFFLAIAFSQAVALFGFVFAFLGAPTWIYDLTAAFAIFRLWTVEPPTRARLRQHQAALTASGCGLSLVGALRTTRPPSR